MTTSQPSRCTRSAPGSWPWLETLPVGDTVSMHPAFRVIVPPPLPCVPPVPLRLPCDSTRPSMSIELPAVIRMSPAVFVAFASTCEPGCIVNTPTGGVFGKLPTLMVISPAPTPLLVVLDEETVAVPCIVMSPPTVIAMSPPEPPVGPPVGVASARIPDPVCMIRSPPVLKSIVPAAAPSLPAVFEEEISPPIVESPVTETSIFPPAPPCVWFSAWMSDPACMTKLPPTTIFNGLTAQSLLAFGAPVSLQVIPPVPVMVRLPLTVNTPLTVPSSSWAEPSRLAKVTTELMVWLEASAGAAASASHRPTASAADAAAAPNGTRKRFLLAPDGMLMSSSPSVVALPRRRRLRLI